MNEESHDYENTLVDHLRARIETLVMERARLQAQCSVHVQTLSMLARQGLDMQRWALNRLRAAEAAARAVRREDLTVATLNREG